MPSVAAESWVRQKVAVIRQYLQAFVAHQVGKVDDIIFVDLFAGNGMYSLGARRELFAGSALMSLSLDVPISKYVFCEHDPDRLGTLKIRVNKYFRKKNVVLLHGRPEEIVDRLELYVPTNKGSYRSAVFCLCDPFSLEVPFTTIQRLAEKDFTFLIPFTFALNDRLNFEYYLVDARERLKKYLGTEQLERVEKGVTNNITFYKGLIRVYQNNLLALGYNGATSVHKIDSGLMEVPVYYIGLYSKTISTKAIQNDVEASHHVQFDLFDP